MLLAPSPTAELCNTTQAGHVIKHLALPLLHRRIACQEAHGPIRTLRGSIEPPGTARTVGAARLSGARVGVRNRVHVCETCMRHNTRKQPQERQAAERLARGTGTRAPRTPANACPGAVYLVHLWCTCPACSRAICDSSRARAYAGSHSCGRSAAAPPRSRSAPGRALSPLRHSCFVMRRGSAHQTWREPKTIGENSFFPSGSS